MQKSSTSESHRAHVWGVIMVLLSAGGFSAKAIIIKLVYQYGEKVDVITLLMLRMIMALPFFLGVAFFHGGNSQHYQLKFREWLAILLLGFFGYYLASYLDFTGLKYIPASLERLLLFLYPTFVVILSALFGKRLISIKELLALLLTYGGTAFVFFNSVQDSSNNLIIGSVLVLSSALVFACFLMGSAKMINRIGSARFTAYSMTVACLVAISHYALQHGVKWPDVAPDVFFLVLVMAIMSTVLPAFFMNAGIQRIGAGRASIISTTGPICTLFLAYWVLGEVISSAQIIGTLLVLSGVYVISRK